ncbi:MAG: DUF1573 domain-containing protein [Flavobacteriales bacterium]|nr:DUF1573 domain-containing protein [Flavobacteriales bacterium]
MTKILIIFFLFSLGLLFYSCEQKTEKNFDIDNKVKKIEEVNKLQKTVISYDSIFDAGQVKKGKQVTAIFKCKNIGSQPWQIAEISASCGCTNATKAPEKSIAVGDSFEIKALFLHDKTTNEKAKRTEEISRESQSR